MMPVRVSPFGLAKPNFRSVTTTFRPLADQHPFAFQNKYHMML